MGNEPFQRGTGPLEGRESSPGQDASAPYFLSAVHGEELVLFRKPEPLITVLTVHTGTIPGAELGGDNTQAAINCFRSCL